MTATLLYAAVGLFGTTALSLVLEVILLMQKEEPLYLNTTLLIYW